MAEESHKGEAAEPRRSRSRAYDRAYDESSAVGPTDSDTESWAERERNRRQAWLQGPSEEEKLEWARSERRHRSSGSRSTEDPAGLGPSDEEVDAWAARERRRREEWLAGPTEDEKVEWSRRKRRDRDEDDDDYLFRPAGFRRRRDGDGGEWLWNPMMPFLMIPAPRRRRNRDEDDDTVARRLSREAVQAAEGAVDLAVNWPYRAWSNLVRRGRDWEEDDYEPSRPRRIRYRDDDD